MTSYEKYVFYLCLIVFALLTLVFAYMLGVMTIQSLRLIHAGAEDHRLLRSRGRKKITSWISFAFSVLFACAFVAIFAGTFAVRKSENELTQDVPTLRVVYSDSMSKKHQKNTYLVENDLNDQFDRYDIVVTRALPEEKDLKLYDIVVYELEDMLVIHRIVGIEEPNSSHPNERRFILQGDYVDKVDKFPVKYSQMKAIYKGERIPFVGSFVMFLQSPAGYICLILVIAEMVISPILSLIIERAERERSDMIGGRRR